MDQGFLMADVNADADKNRILLKGRLSETPDDFVGQFTASVHFDHRLAMHDLAGSVAHVSMLGKTGILQAADCDAILQGLERIKAEISAGEMNWSVQLEDVHMNIEHRLIELVGEAGKKLHTARSRNDQVATSMRLWLRAEVDQLAVHMADLGKMLCELARRHAEAIMPGLTHLQTAQPVTFGHHLMAWVAMLERDLDRLKDCRKRLNRLPLGAAALAGTRFPIDRQFVAEMLGFEGICDNSLDAVSDRDFAIEFCSVCSLLMMHLSRWSEELIFWSSAQLKFIQLPDRFCTGSSIMPQKKNPDIPELVRGKAGRIFGHLMALLTLMKGQPLAYNKDNQEDKEPLFDAVDTASDCVRVLTSMLAQVSLNEPAMSAAAGQDGALATDLADYLAARGLPFRQAHEIVGAIVAEALAQNKELAALSLKQLQAFSDKIEADVFDAISLKASVEARSHKGGTSPDNVRIEADEAEMRFNRAVRNF